MARKPRPSDQLQNARKRARRAADRLEREGNSEVARQLRTAASIGHVTSVSQLDAMRERALSSLPSSTVRVSTEQVRVPKARGVPRPKTPADELYNARRRLRRQAEKLEREAKKIVGKTKDLLSSFAEMLRGEAEKTKGIRLSAAKRAEEIGRLSKLRERTKGASYGLPTVARRNKIFMQQMNAAGTKDADSSINEAEKSIFWVATKGLWTTGADVPRNERYSKIIQHFYFSDNSDSREFREWAEKKGYDLNNRPGDLMLVFEYIVYELNKKIPKDEGTDFDYEGYSKSIRTVR